MARPGDHMFYIQGCENPKIFYLSTDKLTTKVFFFVTEPYLSKFRVFSQHFGNMTRPLELGIFASFYTKLGKNTPYNKNKNIKYFVYSTSYSSLTHKQILKSDLQSDLPFVVGAQKNPLIKMVLLSTHNICFA